MSKAHSWRGTICLKRAAAATLVRAILRVGIISFSCAVLSIFTLKADENVGIGTAKPDSSAVLDISIETLSRPRGVLFPRMTSLQRDSIILPAAGLVIFNTSGNRIEINRGTRVVPQWQQFLLSGQSTGVDWSLFGNGAADSATHFLGTTNSQPLIVKTNGSERMRLTSNGYLGIGTSIPLALLSVGARSQFRVDSVGHATASSLNLEGSNAPLFAISAPRPGAHPARARRPQF